MNPWGAGFEFDGTDDQVKTSLDYLDLLSQITLLLKAEPI
jgi:hypothetical protein